MRLLQYAMEKDVKCHFDVCYIISDLFSGARGGSMSRFDHSLALQPDHGAVPDVHVRWLSWQREQLLERNALYELLHGQVSQVATIATPLSSVG